MSVSKEIGRNGDDEDSDEVENDGENLTSEKNQGDGNLLVSRSVGGRSSPVSRKSSPISGSNSGISPESPKAVMKESLKDLLGMPLPEVQKLPGTPIPLARVTISWVIVLILLAWKSLRLILYWAERNEALPSAIVATLSGVSQRVKEI